MPLSDQQQRVVTHAQAWCDRVFRTCAVSEFDADMLRVMRASARTEDYQKVIVGGLVSRTVMACPTGELTLPWARVFIQAAAGLEAHHCAMACQLLGHRLAKVAGLSRPPAPFGSLMIHCSCGLPSLSLLHRLQIIVTISQLG